MKKPYAGLLSLALIAVAALGIPLAKGAIQLGGSIFPPTFITQQDLNTTDSFNQMESLINQQVQVNPALANAGIGFSNVYSTNPMLTDIAGAQSGLTSTQIDTSGGTFIVTGLASTTLYPQNLTVLASGADTLVGSSVKVLCSPSGILLGTIGVSNLVTNTAVNIYSSVATSGGIQLTPGAALVSGCAAGDGILASEVGGNITGTTNIFFNIPYVTIPNSSR